jgi:hypothetical protein
MEVGPPVLVVLKLCHEHSLTAGWVGCGSRVGHFDRTDDLGVSCFPFGGLAHRSYPKAFMKQISQFEDVVLGKF